MKHYKEVKFEVYVQGHLDFQVFVVGTPEHGQKEHLGGFQARQADKREVLASVERSARDMLQGKDADVQTNRVVVMLESPRHGRSNEGIYENKIVKR